MRICVNGVDGNFGSIVAKTLLEHTDAQNLVFTAPYEGGLDAYRTSGAALRIANFNHPETLASAFAGVDVMLIISAPFVGKKRQQAHKNAVDAAVAAGVGKIVYTSLVNATDPTNPSVEKIDHAYTETYISEKTDLDYIFLRNSQYAEAMITSFLHAYETGGVLSSNQAEGKMAYISRSDCAIAAAHALLRETSEKAVFNINGPELLTLREFIEIGSRITHKDVSYQIVSDEETYAAFDAMGVPRTTDGDFEDDSPAPYSSEGMVTFAEAIRLGKMDSFTNDFEKLTGHKPRTVAYMFEHIENHQVGKRNSTDQ